MCDGLWHVRNANYLVQDTRDNNCKCGFDVTMAWVQKQRKITKFLI